MMVLAPSSADTLIKDINMNSNGDVKIIIWGVGYLYHKYKTYLETEYPNAYVWDRRFIKSDESYYEGHMILSPEDLPDEDKCRIILCMTNENVMNEIELSLDFNRFTIERLIDSLRTDRQLTTDEIVTEIKKNGKYIDSYNNVVECKSLDCMNRISIRFNGNNAKISIGNEVEIADHLEIECGNDCEVVIGDYSTFHKVVIYSAYSNIQIGNDCMVSYGVFIRNHDSHYIFDRKTGRRINYTRTINIGNHVWIGQNSILLPGFSIGDGSVVGAGSISSSSFDMNAIIAGNPAKVIREDVQWDRRMTWTSNYSSMDEL